MADSTADEIFDIYERSYRAAWSAFPDAVPALSALQRYRLAVLTSLAVSGRGAVLTVEDDGPGIPADLLPQVFDRFARGDTSRSRAAGSTGLGLAIVAAVVEAHGGTVDVASRPGRTAVTVRLPCTA